MKVVRVLSMKGRSTKSDAKMVTIFGTKDRVISCIWVRAWNSAMTRPTPRASSSTGAPTLSATRIASRAISMTSTESMASFGS